MKQLCALATLVAALVLPATAGASTIGTKKVFARVTSQSKGVARAYRFTATKRGPVNRLRVFIDRASTAGAVEVALYTGSASRAHARHRRCVISHPRKGAWNVCRFAVYGLKARRSYWLGILQPVASSGRLRYRAGRVKHAPRAYKSKRTHLRALPRRWRNGKALTGRYRPSLYATRGRGGIVAPAPSPAPSPSPSPTPSPGGCAVSTRNVPDGPDPSGGCFPGPSNTGVPDGTVLTNYTGPCTITTPNTVIDSKTVTCDITVRAPGLVIRNSVVHGSVLQEDGVTDSFTISDSLIDGRDPYACINCGVGYRNFTVLRTEIIGTNRGAYCERGCLIQDSWIHGTNLEPVASNEAHASAVRVEQGAVLTHNTLACDYTGPFPNDEIGCSADISGYPDFAPINHNTLTGNLFESNNPGAGYCVYGGSTPGKPYSDDPTNATYVVFRDNVFERGANRKCGAYGPVTNFASGRTGNVWTGNVWDDGATVPPED